MKSLGLVVVFATFACPWQVGAQAVSTAPVVANGMTCVQHPRTGGPEIECKYRVGRDLELTIVGVGEPDASIWFERSSGYDGDYIAGFSFESRCVVVQPGAAAAKLRGPTAMADVAFISPRSGKVFSDADECAADSPGKS